MKDNLLQTKLGKFVWCVVVSACFLVAILLINDSYIDWQKSPIATSISTLPLGGLVFPKVTVCPPKGSHTALNHDLMKLHNDSLSKEDRKALKLFALDTFTKSAHLDYITLMLGVANPEFLGDIYQGLQSVPLTFESSSMLKVFLSKPIGTFQTTGYGGKFDKSFYLRDKMYHYTLEFPRDLMEQMGNDSLLVIELEVDTREEEGWMEEVIAGGEKMKVYNETESLKATDMQTLSGEHFGLLGNILNQNLLTFVGLVHLSRITQGKSWNFIAKTN